MGSIIGVMQGYSNIIQANDAQASINNNNEARLNAVKSLDMGVIEQLGANDPMVASLNKSDKQQVMSNASAAFKKECIEAWDKDIDKQNKEFAEDFNIFAD